jgi:MFS family permease
MLMISAIIGVGLGPVVVGIISDRLGPALGTGSLRAALALVTLAFLLASASLILASKHSTRTLGRAPPQ